MPESLTAAEAQAAADGAALTCTVGRPRLCVDALPRTSDFASPVYLTLAVPCATLPSLDAPSLLRRTLGCP